MMKVFWTLVSGVLFGFGLAYSSMIRPETVLAFLTFQDLGLLLVLGVAVGVNLLVFQFVPRWRAPFSLSTSTTEPRFMPFSVTRNTPAPPMPSSGLRMMS